MRRARSGVSRQADASEGSVPGKVLRLIRRPFPALTEIIHERHAADHVPHLSCLSPAFYLSLGFMKQRFIRQFESKAKVVRVKSFR
ncbi:hypothetical protein ACVWWO_008631 [Bradyrhizobium sp. F1.13.1]